MSDTDTELDPFTSLQQLLHAVGDAEVIEDYDTGSRTYLHPVTGQEMISVTSVTGGTQNWPWKEAWAAGLAAVFAANNLKLLNEVLASPAGIGGVIDLIKGAAKRSRELKKDAGSAAHKLIESLIKWQASPGGTGGDVPLPVVPDELGNVDMDGIAFKDFVDTLVNGFFKFVEDFNPVFLAAEMNVFNPALGVAGTLDLIILLRDTRINEHGKLERCLGRHLILCVDIKTGKFLDAGMLEQVATYRRMTEVALPMDVMAAMPACDASAILHLRPEHEHGYRLHLVSGEDDAKAWNRFRRALDIFTGRKACRDKPGIVVWPPQADGSPAPTRIADLDDEGYGQVPGRLRKAGKHTLDELTDLSELECLALKGIGPKSIPVINAMLAAHGLALRVDEPVEVAS